MMVATQTAATDPRTGTIDMGLINTGRSEFDKDLVLKLADTIKEILQNSNPSLERQRITVGQLRQMVIKNMNNGKGPGYNNGGIILCFYLLFLTTIYLGNISVSMNDIEDAVKELASENVVQYIEKNQTILVLAK
jgi:DNA replicative helicase MCM subunit Mcm2 (Cdc46/Mcm family)